MDTAVVEIISYALLIKKKFPINMGPVLNGYGAVDVLKNTPVNHATFNKVCFYH